MRRRDPLAVHNERTRIFASFLNAIGLGFIGFALLRPLVEGTVAFDEALVLWVAAGLAFHAIAQYVLGYIEKEVPNDDL